MHFKIVSKNLEASEIFMIALKNTSALHLHPLSLLTSDPTFDYIQSMHSVFSL